MAWWTARDFNRPVGIHMSGLWWKFLPVHSIHQRPTWQEVLRALTTRGKSWLTSWNDLKPSRNRALRNMEMFQHPVKIHKFPQEHWGKPLTSSFHVAKADLIRVLRALTSRSYTWLTSWNDLKPSRNRALRNMEMFQHPVKFTSSNRDIEGNHLPVRSM